MAQKQNDIDVSIIVVNYNTCTYTLQCLESVFKQTSNINFEVIVVDNASADGLVELVKSEFPQVTLIENSQNRGFAAANNQAIKVAKGRYILLLNSDTVILDNAIAKVVDFADANPDAAVVGCRVLNPDLTLQPTCFMFPSILNLFLSSSYLYKLFPQSKFFGRQHMMWWKRNDTREVDVVWGCFMLVRQQAIQKVGLMDERFFMYAEETDWCYRFKQARRKILFTSDAEIVHSGGQSTKQMASEMTLQLRGGTLQFMHKHHSRLEYKLACLLVWLFFVVRIPPWFAKYLLNKQERTYCRMRMLAYTEGMWKLMTGGGKALCLNASEL